MPRHGAMPGLAHVPGWPLPRKSPTRRSSRLGEEQCPPPFDCLDGRCRGYATRVLRVMDRTPTAAPLARAAVTAMRASASAGPLRRAMHRWLRQRLVHRRPVPNPGLGQRARVQPLRTRRMRGARARVRRQYVDEIPDGGLLRRAAWYCGFGSFCSTPYLHANLPSLSGSACRTHPGANVAAGVSSSRRPPAQCTTDTPASSLCSTSATLSTSSSVSAEVELEHVPHLLRHVLDVRARCPSEG